MGKGGRKSCFNDKIQSTIVRLIKDGKTEDQIAEIVGVSRTTINNWKGKHPEFLYAVRESRQAADELVEAALFSRALGCSHPETKVSFHEGCPITETIAKHYPPDTQAAMFWLRNRQPERWKEKTEGDVNVTQNNNVNAMTDEQLDARIAQYAEKLGKEK